MRRAGDVDRLQRLVAADAVIGVHDEIAGRQVVHLGDELVEVAAAARDPRQPVAEDVLLAEQQHAVGGEALFERQDREADRPGRQCCECLAIGDPVRAGDAVLAQHGSEPVGRAGAERRHRDLSAGASLRFEIGADRGEQPALRIGALDGEMARRPGAGIEPVRPILGHRERRQPDRRPRLDRPLPFEIVEKKRSGRTGR